MTPIYASDRANIAGWYAFNMPPGSRRAFWDGGEGKRGQEATGFWCPYEGTIIDAPDDLIEKMPKVALDCVVHNGEVIVTGFPRIEFMVTESGENLKRLDLDYVQTVDGSAATFIDELSIGEDLLEGTPCRLVHVEKLPDDREEALEYFRENYRIGVCRCPQSVWSPLRSCYMMVNIKPESVYQGRVREVIREEAFDTVDYVTVWAGPEKELNLVPLYDGDDDPDCPLWKPKNKITLYCVEDLVVGYE